jgi:hypothetical protein
MNTMQKIHVYYSKQNDKYDTRLSIIKSPSKVRVFLLLTKSFSSVHLLV